MESISLSIEHSAHTWFGCLVDDQDRLVASAFGPDPRKINTHLADYSKTVTGVSPALNRHSLTSEMIRRFDGEKPPESVRLNKDFISLFQRQVIGVLDRIPTGKVTTYGLIAKRIDSAPRPVGGAVGSNPWPIFVPCHRVVNGDLTIGNYSMCGTLGHTGTVTKKNLLNREHVPIQGDKIDRIALWKPSEKMA